MAEIAKQRDPNTELRNPQLRQWVEDTRHTTGEFRKLVAERSDVQLRWKPNQKTWSILECIDHLLVTGNLYYPKIKEAVRQARESGMTEKRPFSPSFFQKHFISFVHPDSKRRLKTFSIFKPTLANTDPDVPQRFFDQQEVLCAILRSADGLDLNTLRIPSPLTSLLKFSIGEALWLNVLHVQRHFLQARNLSRVNGFPAV